MFVSLGQSRQRYPRQGSLIAVGLNRVENMIDIMVLRELFAEEFGTAQSVTEPRIARFDPLSDAERERVYRDLKASGHELLWALQTQLPQLKRDGWEPLIRR